MKTRDWFGEVILGVTANKVRSGLTVLGIVIGIASVIAMLAIGQGAKQQIEGNIQSIGSNLIMVLPGASRGIGMSVSAGRGGAQTLTVDDAAALTNLPSVLAVAPESSRRFQVIASGKNTNTQIIGTMAADATVRNLTIDRGSFLTENHQISRARVAVLGSTVRDDLFGVGAENVVGSKVRINGMEFSVIGVMASKGGSGFSNQDDAIWVPLSSLQTFLSGGSSVSTIVITAVSQEAMTDVQAAVTNVLLTRHRSPSVEQADFTVLNQNDLASAASAITGTFTILLAAIASISLLVGGIGIMNMMLTSVTERTREIGLREAIGAKPEDIIQQFLGEAVLLTVFGGVMGIVLGYIAAAIIQAATQVQTLISWSSIFLACGVSIGIGVVFGFYPALKASRLNPIEALRHE